MSKGIKGKLIQADYSNLILNGTFLDKNGVKHHIINAKAIPCNPQSNGQKEVLFKVDQNNPEQDDLFDMCLSIHLKNSIKSNSELSGDDFIDQDESYIYLNDNE